MEHRLNIKKFIFLAIIVILAFATASIAYYFLTTGTVTVKASTANNIILTPIDKPQAVSQESGKDMFSGRLKAGVYTVTAAHNNTTYKRTVIIKARQHITVAITLKDIGVIEPVSPRSVNGFFADSSGMVFLDTNNQNLYRVTMDNQEQIIDTSVDFTDVKWADSHYGVGQANDGSLYSISDNTISKLQLPLADSITSYAVSKSHRIFVTYDDKLFESTQGKPFKIVSTNGIFHPIILAVSDTGNILLRDDISSSKDKEPVLALVTITNIGTSQKRTYNVGHSNGFQAAWSLDSTKLVIGTPTGTTITDARLNLLSRLPSNTIISPVWLTSDIIAYGLGDKVWAFNVTDNSSYALGATYNQQSISAVFSGHDGNHLYINEQNSSTGQQLGRLSIQHPQAKANLVSIAIILPTTIDECSIGYLNFTKVTVVTYGPDASMQSCLQKTQAYLKTYPEQFKDINPTILFSTGN